ncbi:MAG: hypothetical protein RBG13Loki_2404 [Promethearchaeota archaeon CR_4]|nr:MAG: hypothetical protein RBG13Loki_2404 [Candidatus Lokiarchaeota archaeon CR_4]
MEIERKHKKETTWVIKRKDQPGVFMLKSEEETGIGSSYAVIMKQADAELNFKMNHEEFSNFISILNGFKDVVIVSESEENLPESKGIDTSSDNESEADSSPPLEGEIVNPKTPSDEKDQQPKAPSKSESNSDLDPTEWDPF